MLKKGYKVHVATNKFDLNTLPTCGAKTRSGGLCEHKGNIRNGRCKRHVRTLQTLSTNVLEKITTAIYMG